MKGSVFKRCVKCSSRVEKRRCQDCGSGDYTWAFIVDIGRDAHGRRRQRQRQGFDSKQDAEKALRQLLTKVDTDQLVETSDLTVRQYLVEEWLPTIRPPKVRPSTYHSYQAELKRHLIPHLGGVRLQKLHAVQLNKLYAHLLEEGRMDGEGGLSARTVRYVHTILRRALKDAVRWGRLERNPADLADPPKQDRAHGGHMRTWDASQQKRFLEYVAEDRLAAAWTLLITTGMRRGEILGLRWTDVDLDNARLAVRQTYVSVDGNAQFSEPKTRKSRRSIDLDGRTVQALRDWRKAQDEDREEWTAAGAWEEHGLVFTQRNGRPLDPDHFSQDFVRLSKEAGLPRIRLHDVRHSHATLLLAAGVNPKVASERLGHHSVAFTLDVYSHVVPGMQAEAAEKIADLIHAPEPDEETDSPPDEADDVQDPGRS